MTGYDFEQAKTEYRAFCEAGAHDIQVFAQPWYLDAVCLSPDDWRVIIVKEGAKIVAAFPFEYTRNRRGFWRIGNPWQAARLGIWMDYGNKTKGQKRETFENNVARQIIAALPYYDVFSINFDARFLNWREFYNAGFSQTTYYSYVVPSNSSSDNYIDTISKQKKERILKLRRMYQCDYCADINEYWDFYVRSYAKRHRISSYTEYQFKCLITAAQSNNAVAILGLRNEQNNLCATNILVNDSEKAYSLFGSYDPDITPSPTVLLTYLSVLKTIENRLCYDFEGSMIPGVAKYNSEFGAAKEPYYVITNYSDRMRFLMNCKECFSIIKRSLRAQ